MYCQQFGNRVKGIPMRAPKLSMVILVQNDLEKAIEFYTKLGYPLNFQVKDTWAEFNMDGVKLGLVPTKTELPDRRSGVVLEVEDIKEWLEMLRADGVECSEPVERVHGIMASFKDPGNNFIDLYQPTPEKLEEALSAMGDKKSTE